MKKESIENVGERSRISNERGPKVLTIKRKWKVPLPAKTRSPRAVHSKEKNKI